MLHHHLASRSPWRTARSVQVPRRPGLVALVFPELPRSGPFRLDAGRAALDDALRRARLALARPVDGPVVEVG